MLSNNAERARRARHHEDGAEVSETAKIREPDPRRAVASLALEASVPFAEVARLYEAERARLESGARVKSFLPVFAMRNVREILRRRREHEEPASHSARELAHTAA